ncbi:MAG: twin-arginine translocase subunit TatC [Pseudomonadales bacterium]|nr:twin-arginine translocase subunit TatC [Pseudomonadales bacterium]
MTDANKTPDTAGEENDPTELPLISHLVELRNRLLRSIAVIFVLFLCMAPWANNLYEFVAAPLTAVLDPTVGERIIATRPFDTFLAPFKLTFMLALFLSIPYLLHQAWAFISPGLYKNEIRVTLPIIVSSVILFYLGVAFSYFVLLGFVFQFLVKVAPNNVTVMTDMAAYLNFVMNSFLAFGLAFEIPVATVLLVISGVATPQSLAQKRSYVIIGSFFVAIFLTPPDPFSQSMLAIPMCLLYEVGIIASRMVYRPDENDTGSAVDKKSEA